MHRQQSCFHRVVTGGSSNARICHICISAKTVNLSGIIHYSVIIKVIIILMIIIIIINNDLNLHITFTTFKNSQYVTVFHVSAGFMVSLLEKRFLVMSVQNVIPESSVTVSDNMKLTRSLSATIFD